MLSVSPWSEALPQMTRSATVAGTRVEFLHRAPRSTEWRTAGTAYTRRDGAFARTISSFDAYFPVPTMSRERNERPPMVRGESVLGSAWTVVIAGR